MLFLIEETAMDLPDAARVEARDARVRPLLDEFASLCHQDVGTARCQVFEGAMRIDPGMRSGTPVAAHRAQGMRQRSACVTAR